MRSASARVEEPSRGPHRSLMIQHGKDWSFAMAIKLRDDFDARMLRVEAICA